MAIRQRIMRDTSSTDRMIESIETLAPLIEADKLAFDETRRLTSQVVAAMHDIGLFNLYPAS
jgi:hypothetical protein